MIFLMGQMFQNNIMPEIHNMKMRKNVGHLILVRSFFWPHDPISAAFVDQKLRISWFILALKQM